MKKNDLTQGPPRSARVRLGGYVILPRVLDKCRAVLAGTAGEYKFNCPLDQSFFEFAGIDAEAFKQQVAAGKGDGEMLEWVNANAKTKRTPPEVRGWSCYHEVRTPDNTESREYFNEIHKSAGPKRTDISNWFELLDLDDYASFGGKV